MHKLYSTDEWKELNLLDRAQLLLVVEGVKRGCIIGEDRRGLDIATHVGLDRYFGDRTVMLMNYSDSAVYEYLLNHGEDDRATIHRTDGWALGYPNCCIEEYVRTTSSADNKGNFSFQGTRFYQEIIEMIGVHGRYPGIFDYRPPSFTPCSVNCKNAIAMLSEYKAVLDKLDPEAAKGLKEFNRRGMPQKLVYGELK